MRFSNDGRIWAPWRAYAFTKNWTLTGGAGTKNVDVQFRDRAGNVSTITTDSIIHRPITVAKEVVHVREAADAQKPATGGKAVAAAVKLPDSGGPALLPPIAGLLLVGARVVRLLAGLIGKPSRNQA